MTFVRMERGTPTGVPLPVVPAPWATSPNGSYVHRARSAFQYRHGVVVHAWCGMSLQHPRWIEDPGAYECGSCHGRWLAQLDDTGLLFSPHLGLRDLCPGNRRWCPGPRQGMTLRLGWFSATSAREKGRCLLCGYEGRILDRMEPHEPVVPNALVWCPTCGFDNLWFDGKVVRCRRWQCTYEQAV